MSTGSSSDDEQLSFRINHGDESSSDSSSSENIFEEALSNNRRAISRTTRPSRPLATSTSFSSGPHPHPSSLRTLPPGPPIRAWGAPSAAPPPSRLSGALDRSHDRFDDRLAATSGPQAAQLQVRPSASSVYLAASASSSGYGLPGPAEDASSASSLGGVSLSWAEGPVMSGAPHLAPWKGMPQGERARGERRREIAEPDEDEGYHPSLEMDDAGALPQP